MTRAGYSSIDELPLSAQARSLWGKTDRDAGEQWLPLYVHMSDSALVAKQIWDEWLPEGTRKIIADEFDGDAVLARKTTMFLAGIHDLGKATPVFQSKPITYAPNAADGSMAWIPEKAGLTVGHFDNYRVLGRKASQSRNLWQIHRQWRCCRACQHVRMPWLLQESVQNRPTEGRQGHQGHQGRLRWPGSPCSRVDTRLLTARRRCTS